MFSLEPTANDIDVNHVLFLSDDFKEPFVLRVVLNSMEYDMAGSL